MLVVKIKHPEPVVVAPATAMGYQGGRAYNPPSRIFGDQKHMPKIDYSNWIEGVKTRFKVGDKVTLDNGYSGTNHYKVYYYEITGISEIHYMPEWDGYYNEPMCLYCITQYGHSMTKCPSAVRLLTMEELERVRLQDQNQRQQVC